MDPVLDRAEPGVVDPLRGCGLPQMDQTKGEPRRAFARVHHIKRAFARVQRMM